MNTTARASAMFVIMIFVIVLRLLRSTARASGVVSMLRGIFVIVLPSQDAFIDFVKHDAFDFLKESLIFDDTIQGKRIVDGFSFEANRIGFGVFVEDVQLHGFEVIVRVNVDFRPKVKVVSVEGEGLVYFFHGVILSE